MTTNKKILITGGAGFIGSHLVEYMAKTYPQYSIAVVDSLTYAAKKSYLQAFIDSQRIVFFQQDISDKRAVHDIFNTFKPDWIFHLAAESHVDRSIENSSNFVTTNVVGTINLLDAYKELINQTGEEDKLFYHVSTDEVYGSLSLEETNTYFTEKTPYSPRSPYAASKAASDHFVRAYAHTYTLPILMSNCSNNYGPHQHFEKLIPVVINACVKNLPIPVYGKGENIRDWIYVKDHVCAIDKIAHNGKLGETYNVGAGHEMLNIDLVKKICIIVDELMNKKESSQKDITFVKDRLGHDLRYAIDSTKVMEETGWKPQVDFEQGLRETVAWYINEIV